MKCVTFLLTLCIVAISPENCLLADDIYKDKDGVWRNREAKQSKTVIEGAVDQVLVPPKESDEIYQDKDGVWRNRTVKENKPLASGLESVNRGLVEGAIGIMDSTVGNAARTAIENQGKSSQQNINLIFEKSRQQHQYREDVKRIEELKQPKSDFTGYERFDPAKVGEVKSEWEYYDDPRSKK